MLKEEKISVLETFDIKFTIPGEKESRVDVRVKFEGCRPTVLQAKMNEVKTLVFDVLCLHRYCMCICELVLGCVCVCVCVFPCVRSSQFIVAYTLVFV